MRGGAGGTVQGTQGGMGGRVVGKCVERRGMVRGGVVHWDSQSGSMTEGRLHPESCEATTI